MSYSFISSETKNKYDTNDGSTAFTRMLCLYGQAKLTN